MIASRCSRCTPAGSFIAFWSWIAILLAVLGATPAAAGTVVGVSMTDPSITSVTAGGWIASYPARALSDDGRWLVFQSGGTDLVPPYTGTDYQVYLYDRQTNDVRLVSGAGGSAGQGGNSRSYEPLISGDGAYVAFYSDATDLVSGGSGPASFNVYVWERSSGTTTLVSESVSASGQRGNNSSYAPVFSGDGAYVTFYSYATDLVSGGSGPSTLNVYLWERASGTTTLVSRSVSAAGQRGNGNSYSPLISGDGAYVAFTSTATDLVTGGSGPSTYNVYVWERSTGTATLVSESVSAAGQRGNSDSYEAVISDDGSYVAFYGSATDLVSGGTGPSTQNVYLWERASGTTILVSVSVSATGQRGNGHSSSPVISGDGAYVAFYSSATDLASGGSGPSNPNVYAWERSSGTTTLVSESVSAAGQRGNGASSQPVISSDGATVVFLSYATDLVTGGSGPSTQNVYVWQRSSGTTMLVSESISAAGRRGISDSYQPAISGDGAFVAFWSPASDLVSGDGAFDDAFVAEVSTGIVVTASRRDSGVAWSPITGNSGSHIEGVLSRQISDDGSYLVFSSAATDLVSSGSGPTSQNVYVWERSSGTTTLVSESVSAAMRRGNGTSFRPAISGDGAYVAFLSTATDLVLGGTGPSTVNVYVWERSSGTTSLVSGSAAGQRGNSSSNLPVISGDGSYVAFSSEATDLISGGTGPSHQSIYLWERSSGTTTLVSESVSAAGQRGNNHSSSPVISSDGLFVAFNSSATDLVSGGSGPGSYNIYVWDRSNGTATLVSESVSAAGQRGNNNSFSPVISGEGAFLAFQSTATDLVTGGSGPSTQNVYFWERSSGTTTLVSESASVAGQRGDSHSYDFAISGDGAIVAFSSEATNLVTGGSGPSTRNVYLWERSSETTTLASGSVSAAGQRGNSHSYELAISGDGATVAFASEATDLVIGESGPSTRNVYVRQLSSGTTTLVSESMSVAGQRGSGHSHEPVISGDGATVAFWSEASDLISRDFNNTSDVFLWSSGAPLDTTAPTDPTALAAQAPHVENAWSNLATVTMEWSGAADEVGGSGLAGYSFVWDHNATSTPDTLVDVVHGADPHSTTSPPLAEGAAHYFHLRTCDLAGNCTSALHRGPYDIDLTLPSIPGGVSSSTHVPGIANPEGDLSVAWAEATDALSGVAGYSWELDSNPTWSCDQVADGDESITATTFPALSDGSYYLHVCAVDAAGNWGLVRNAGPYVVNGTAPSSDLFVYYSRIGAGEIRRVRANGFDDSLVLGGLSAPLGLAVDPRGGKIYVALAGTNAIARCNLDGTGLETLVSSAGGPYGVALDVDSGKVYWAARAAGQIRRANLDGTGAEAVLTALHQPTGVAFDRTWRKVYWSEDSFAPAAAQIRLGRSEPDGSGIEVLLTLPGATNRGYALDVDPVAQKVYWVNTQVGGGTVRVLNYDGTGDAALVSGLAPAEIEIDPSSGHLFWSEEQSGTVRRAAFDGSSPVTLSSGGNRWGTSLLIPESPPVALAQVLSVPEDGQVAVRLRAYDPDNDALSWSVTLQPAHGTLSGTAPDLIYTPAPDFIGADFFEFQVDDSNSAPATATIAISVTAVDEAPTDPTSLTAMTPHVEGGWSNQPAITMTWSGAADDPMGTGVAGYSVEWNVSPISTPDASLEVDHTIDPHSFVAALVDGGGHYFHLRTCDNGGNCTSTLHAGPFWIDTTAPGAPGAISSSSHDPTGTPVADGTIAVAWGAASDTLSGVASYRYAFDGNPTGSCLGSSTASLAAASGAIANGGHYVHVCAVDLAGNTGAAVHGGPYVVDTAGPAGLAVSSLSHSPSTWSSDSSIDFTFSGASDTSGVVGYAIELDQAAATVPACATTQAASTFTGSSSADGNDWWIHVRSRDGAGNCGDTVHFGPFWIDTIAAGGPSVLASMSHSPAVWSNDATVDVQWSGASDGGSGLGGYSVDFDAENPNGPPVHDFMFGSLGAGNGQFNQPRGLAVGGDGNLYVADFLNDRVQKLDSSGAYLAKWGSGGGGDGQFNSIQDVAVAPTGEVYAVDAVLRRVQKFSSTGVFLLKWGTSGAGTGQFNSPWGIAVDAFGDVYVSDSGNSRIQKFDSNGAFLLAWGSGGAADGQFNQPRGLSVDSFGSVYVVDSGNSRVQKFDSSGTFLTKWGSSGTGNGQFSSPNGITVDASGRVLVGDTENARVQQFSSTGAFQQKWGAPGSGPGQFAFPYDPVVNAEGAIFVVEASNHRIQKFVEPGVPDVTVDIPHVLDPHSTTSVILADGQAHYFHLRSCDLVGNCSSSSHLGPFWIDTSVPGAPGAISSSSHDPAGTAVSDATIDVAWGAATDTFAGVVSYSYAFDGNPTGSCLGSSTASLSATSGALADGSHYVHVCAVDFAGNTGAAVHGGPYVVDTAGPTGLAVSSPSHDSSTWSNDNGVDFSFTGATDVGSVAGYAVAYDQSSGTEPACTTTQTASTFTGSSSPDGDDWWIHVRARDAAGNCGDTVHSGPFWIDTTAPGAPGSVISSSHESGPTNDTTIDVAWGAASDGLSGIDGYSFFFNGVDEDCDGTMDSDFDERSATSPPLAAGSWYFHVCAVDLAGNWGAVTTGGPYTIDLSAPKVTNLDSIATSGGAIGEGEVVNVEITQLLVSFDEAMDATLAAATSSYLLVTAGIDGVLDTAACGPLQGDDQSVSVDSPTYAGQTSTLAVNGATALTDGTYRLLVCASLEDAAGNSLDGDGNGSPGDDFVRSFRVDLTPPTVTLVDTVADTGDGVLAELEPTNVAITELSVSFDEEIVGGDSSSNFLLVEGGLDGTLDTTACGPLAGDDTSLAIDSAVYASRTSRLVLTGGAALPDGEYRLLVCATLTDLGGNALDGDLDGDGHDDFARSFTVDTVPPTNPTAISSSTHLLGAWSSLTGFSAEWSGGTDDRSGLAGASMIIDGNPNAAVDCTIEVAGAAGTGSTAATLGEGAWYVHVRLRDRAGNCAVGETEAGFWGIDTSAPGAPGTISSSSHDPVSSPVSDTTIDVAWGAASDGLSGIAGYSFHFSADDDEGCDGTMDGPGDERTGVSPVLADGSWYLHVCAVDLAGNTGAATHGGPWIVDTTPPSGLAVSSSSHTVSTWSNDNSVDFSFSGATDANGVAGYSVVHDQASATEPVCSTTQISTTFTGSSSPDGNHWWIHVRARDTAGNCGPTVHLGPFWIDTVAPGTVSGLVSTDHAVGLPSIDPTIAMSWSAATDDRSGVAGYSVQFSSSASSTCDGGQETASTSFTSAALAHGYWYVQVCARDEAGNWGAVTQAGPYTIDLVAPQVILVDSVVATADNQLAEGETTGLAITQLRVTFGEGMSTSVSLATSYRLIAAGSDGVQTVSCAGGVSAQDLAVSIDSVSSLGGSTYGLAVDGGVALPTGDYRLLACASLTDAAGNHLDGNGDTVANDDFVRNFRVDRSPPTVSVVETTAPTSGAGLDEGEATNVALTTFTVTFSEPVYDPIGHTNPDDVTNPGNYRLVESGGDGFQTVSCQMGVDPSDVALAVDGVTYDGLSHTVTLSVNGGAMLGEGIYRLYVCGTAAIVDLLGYPLDGDENGTGGDDFVRNFQVDTTTPSNPVLTPNLPPGAWTNANGLVVTWSGATDDSSGAGLAGYSVLFDLASGTDPGTSIDIVEAAAHQAAMTLADGAPHYFHLVTCDRAGNCAPPIETGPFQVDTQVPSTPAPVASSSHGDGLPHSNAAIAVNWTASVDQPGLSGVSGYGVSLQSAVAPPVCGGTSTGSTSTTLNAPGDGTYFVHVCAIDLAGNSGGVAVAGPYIVDTAGPAGLVVSSSSHSVSTWSNDNTVDFSWSGATDPVSVAGYAVAYDQSSATEPACAATQTASTFTGSSSPDADNWWLHVRAIDGAGNCGGTVHLGPFQVDTQIPAAPTGLASPSHDVGVASNDDTVEVDWQAAIDQAGLSGIDGYGFFFSTGEDDDCAGVQDVEEDVLTTTSAALADGEHHFHLCAVDNAGNWSQVASIGPFVIDTAGAAVVAIGTVADTGDGELTEGESTQSGLTQLTVVFDGAMSDATGDSDPADVTNPENYRLYQAGPNRVVQTVTCGTAIGDDVEVAFAAASYSASTTTTALSLSGSLALPRESYRLLVCSTLEDDAGTPIPGFSRNFTVTTTDLAANPNLDRDLAGWVVTEPVPGSLLWSSSDLSSAPTSGSAEILTAGGSGGVWALSQCFADLGGPFVSSGWTIVESAVAGDPIVGVRLDFFDGAGCSGVLLDSTLSPPVAGDTGGLRTYLQLARNGSPEAALSVLMTVEVEGGAEASFTVRLDDLFHGHPPALFSDGFESSDTSAWSATVPVP